MTTLSSLLPATLNTLQTVTDQGATTTNDITVGNLTSTGIDDNATSTAITIDSSQNVGIGLANPAATFAKAGSLDANGIVVARGLLNANQTDALVMEYGSNVSSIRSYGATSGTGQLVFKVGGGGGLPDSEAVRIDASGNVGVGITPLTDFHLFRGSAPAELRVQAGGVSNGAKLALYGRDVSDVNSAWSLESVEGVLSVADDGTERMRIDASGNVGVGTAAPNAKLDVDGNGDLISMTYAADGGNALLSWKNSAGTTLWDIGGGLVASQNELVFRQAGTVRGMFDSSGNLLIGVTSFSAGVEGWKSGGRLTESSTNATTSKTHRAFYNPNGQVGTITTSGSSTSYNTSSDYRLKNVTGPIQNSGEYIDSLNPVEGTWKADGSTFVGLIAHEAQEASRTPVATGKKDEVDENGKEVMQGMDYSSAEIIANLIAEVKALRARMAQMEALY